MTYIEKFNFYIECSALYNLSFQLSKIFSSAWEQRLRRAVLYIDTTRGKIYEKETSFLKIFSVDNRSGQAYCT